MIDVMSMIKINKDWTEGSEKSVEAQVYSVHRRISSEILDMAQYSLPVKFDKYIVLDQELLPFPI